MAQESRVQATVHITKRVCRSHPITMATALFSKAETVSLDVQINETSFYIHMHKSMKLCFTYVKLIVVCGASLHIELYSYI
jgi:hypothetical protein